MDALHPRRVDVDLIQRTWFRRLRNVSGAQLESEDVPRRTVFGGDVVIGTHGRRDHRDVGTDDAIDVEADDRPDVGRQTVEHLRPPVVVSYVGIERRREQLDERLGDRRVCAQNRRHVIVAVGRTALTQIFGIGTQNCRFAPGQAAAKYEFVEIVHLCITAPDLCECVGESMFDVVGGLFVDRHTLGERETELVDVARLAIRTS